MEVITPKIMKQSKFGVHT